MTVAEIAVRELVDRETRAWDTKDVALLLTIFHPDMVWPWPVSPDAHDPVDWVLEAGRYDSDRWRRNWQSLFDTHTLVHNRRRTVKVLISAQEDAGLAVVDVDTLWRAASGREMHWLGRAGKVYSKTRDGWKMTAHTGLLDYGKFGRADT